MMCGMLAGERGEDGFHAKAAHLGLQYIHYTMASRGGRRTNQKEKKKGKKSKKEKGKRYWPTYESDHCHTG